ncbi:MAG: M20/M25/M40 family metallo-hydrolase [Clostridia bacterium]|nr:M20/M25/M40 family metallo-hydrolase [Clostridia bacterium]
MSDIMNINGRELIELLSLAFGPSGCEDEVRELIMPRASAVADRASIDRMGNLIAVMGFGKGEAKKKIMISSHMDEVGFMISEIKEDGMLGYGCIGGIDPSVVAGRKILVGDEKGQISGIICSKAIHQKSPDEREKAVKHDKLCMDIGAASREEAEKLVKVGDYATFDSEFYAFGKGGRTLKCKALDDRMGCAAMLEIMDSFKADPPKSDIEVYFCFTVREEIGFSGAGTAAAHIAPDLSIVLETTAIGDLPTTEACRRVADVGKGGVVSIVDRSTVYDRELVDRAMEIAKAHEIPAQLKRYVSGGNDAGHIHKALEGVKALAISVPTRYLHSPACVASLDDYESVRDLAEAVMRDIYKA